MFVDDVPFHPRPLKDIKTQHQKNTSNSVGIKSYAVHEDCDEQAGNKIPLVNYNLVATYYTPTLYLQ